MRITGKNQSRWLFSWLTCSLLAMALFMYCHPELFPMHGYSGDEIPSFLPENIRLAGDSWRYISGGMAILQGQSLDALQKSYFGYCLICGVAGRWIIVLQVFVALLSLCALYALGERLGGRSCAILAAFLFACNPELAAWHCAIMTESLYISCVGINAYLALWALDERRRYRMPLVFIFVFLTAFLGPTGWIQLPALLIFWCCSSFRALRWKIAASAAVAFIFVLMAIAFGGGRIQHEGPAEKLYSGEVVWQEELWRVSMPSSDGYAPNLFDGMKYALSHPLASGWLAAKRLGVMFLRIRPSYSVKHNLFLLLYHLPLSLLGIMALFLCRKSRVMGCIAAFVIAHATVVALTFNDNDGRFTLYFTPILAVAAMGALLSLFRWCRCRLVQGKEAA